MSQIFLLWLKPKFLARSMKLSALIQADSIQQILRSHCASVLVGGSARVQTSIHPGCGGFTPQSSLKLTQFRYLCLLHSMAGLSLSTGHLGVCVRACLCERVCACAIPPVWLTSLAVAVRQIERHLLLVKVFRTLGSLAHFLRWRCSYMRRWRDKVRDSVNKVKVSSLCWQIQIHVLCEIQRKTFH